MPSAVLFFGYNLGAPEGSGWEATDADDLGFTIDLPWVEHAEMTDHNYGAAMRRHLLISSGVDEEDLPSEYTWDDLLAKRLGVRVVTYGHSNTEYYGIALEESVTKADDWSPKLVTTLLKGHYHKLPEALEMLGVKPLQENPSWILAPEED